ncbi:MAG TPA: cob(I)yrinic acid a,c-diamide adenosyltransferase [Longimicrobiales bacterium]|nr:cob(I)yrinic acid a,c-diamide adenosyltransferase [Longimicrobiales bacterium]
MTQKIYTKNGDDGETGLFGGGRVPKSDLRVCAYGEVDELNAVIGMALLRVEQEDIRTTLKQIQADLFALGAHLATVVEKGKPQPKLPDLPVNSIAIMEQTIDAAEAELPPLKSFILPGGSEGGAALHFARTVCRRAERSVVALSEIEPVDGQLLIYLNRLSDFLFEMARLANNRSGISETKWP